MLTELESSHEAFLLVQSSTLWIKRFVCKLRRQVRVCGNIKEGIFVDDDSMLGRCVEDLLKRQSCDVKEPCFFSSSLKSILLGRGNRNIKKKQVKYFLETKVLTDARDQCLLNILH